LEAQGGEIALLRAELGGLREEMGRLIATLRLKRDAGPTMEEIQRSMTERKGTVHSSV
jgi:hypothetical protein